MARMRSRYARPQLEQYECYGSVLLAVVASYARQGARCCMYHRMCNQATRLQCYLRRSYNATMLSPARYQRGRVCCYQAVRLQAWKDVLSALEKQVGANGEQLDGEFIPRPRHYLDLLFSAISAKFSQ
eukprot:1253118-Rhodomonas_salina.1